MAEEKPQILGERVRTLEDEFFRKEDQRLIERLRELQQREATREALSRAIGMTNEDVLDRLIALGIRPETASALRVVPLVQVAWADGALDDKERQAVLDNAEKQGIAPGSAEYELLQSWLASKPAPTLENAWKELIRGLTAQMPPAEIAALRSGLVERAQAVARASGGLFGIGKVSAAERDAIDRLEAAFK